MCIVLTFQPWMMLCLYVNCLFVFSGKSELGPLAKWGPYCFLSEFSQSELGLHFPILFGPRPIRGLAFGGSSHLGC